MAASLLQLLCCAICSFASLLTALIFRAAAAAVVKLTYLLRLPGEACNDAIELARGFIQSLSQRALELVTDATLSVVSSLFDALVAAVAESLRLAASSVAGMLEMTRTAVDGLSELLAQVLAGASEMVVIIVQSIWSSSCSAVGYILEKAA